MMASSTARSKGLLLMTMVSTFAVWAARRSFAYSSGGGKLALLSTCLAGTTSFLYQHTLTSKTDCETNNNGVARNKSTTTNLKTRMTSIGRFALESQTQDNPSIPVMFMALSGNTPFTVSDFARLWKERDMANLHPRFHYRISQGHPGHFEPTSEEEDYSIAEHCTESIFPVVYRQELQHRIQTLLLREIPIYAHLWQMELSSGQLGASGAISRGKTLQILEKDPSLQHESLLLFRFHHAIADGVSITAAISDLCDEAQEYREFIVQEMEKRRNKNTHLSLLQKLVKRLHRLLWFWWGSIRVMLYQLHLYWTYENPFQVVKARLSSDAAPGRSISWCDAAPMEQIKRVAKHFGAKVTVNDVIVACTSYAVSKQLEQHQRRMADLKQDDDTSLLSSLEYANVAIPVHLSGGVLLPGKSMGNNIGALVARIPMHDTSSSDRLLQVHQVLFKLKHTPAPLLSYVMAKFCSSWLPSSWTQSLFRRANAGASFVVSNTGRGPPTKLHLGGRAIESAGAFLPLPPGIPIGIVAGSYAGTLNLSVTAESWAVPDADMFLGWFLEEYQRLCDEAQASL